MGKDNNKQNKKNENFKIKTCTIYNTQKLSIFSFKYEWD